MGLRTSAEKRKRGNLCDPEKRTWCVSEHLPALVWMWNKARKIELRVKTQPSAENHHTESRLPCVCDYCNIELHEAGLVLHGFRWLRSTTHPVKKSSSFSHVT